MKRTDMRPLRPIPPGLRQVPCGDRASRAARKSRPLSLSLSTAAEHNLPNRSDSWNGTETISRRHASAARAPSCAAQRACTQTVMPRARGPCTRYGRSIQARAALGARPWGARARANRAHLLPPSRRRAGLVRGPAWLVPFATNGDQTAPHAFAAFVPSIWPRCDPFAAAASIPCDGSRPSAAPACARPRVLRARATCGIAAGWAAAGAPIAAHVEARGHRLESPLEQIDGRGGAAAAARARCGAGSGAPRGCPCPPNPRGCHPQSAVAKDCKGVTSPGIRPRRGAAVAARALAAGFGARAARSLSQA
jgi:hypothetical protein